MLKSNFMYFPPRPELKLDWDSYKKHTNKSELSPQISTNKRLNSQNHSFYTPTYRVMKNKLNSVSKTRAINLSECFDIPDMDIVTQTSEKDFDLSDINDRSIFIPKFFQESSKDIIYLLENNLERIKSVSTQIDQSDRWLRISKQLRLITLNNFQNLIHKNEKEVSTSPGRKRKRIKRTGKQYSVPIKRGEENSFYQYDHTPPQSKEQSISSNTKARRLNFI